MSGIVDRRGSWWAMAVLMLVLAAGCATTEAETAELPGADPGRGEARTEAWAQIVGGLDAPLDETEATTCHRGERSCLEAVVAEMETRLAELGCDHTAPFAFTYLEMTEGVVDAFDTFDDPALISVIDARFAQLYFDAIDNWSAGRLDDVPAVWQLAFAVAEEGRSAAATDLFLGMNAHISRDLAYTVEMALGEDPASVDTPEDYRRVNEIIADVKTPMLEAAAERYDPSLALLDLEAPALELPGPIESMTQWRDRSFELGVRLATAASSAERASVATEIERTSTAAAGLLSAMAAVASPSALTPAQRDAYCERQRAP